MQDTNSVTVSADMNVSVIVCTKGRPDKLLKCIRGLLQNDFKNKEILVVSESKADVNSITDLPVRIVFIPKNKGVAFSRNAGLEASGGDIVAYIDDDAVPDKNWILCLVSSYKQGVVGVGGPIYDPKTRIPLWCGGKLRIIPDFLGLNRGIAIVNRSCFASIEKACDVDVLNGANMSFRRKFLKKIGGFDSSFKFWFEEDDISFRAKLNGGKLLYNPHAKIWHIVYDPFEKKSSFDRNWDYLRHRNLTYFVLKNYTRKLKFIPNLVLYMVFDCIWLTLVLPQNVKGQNRSFKKSVIILRAHIDGFGLFFASRSRFHNK